MFVGDSFGWDDKSIFTSIQKEISKIDNIFEESFEDLNGKEGVVLCSYNANNSLF